MTYIWVIRKRGADTYQQVGPVHTTQEAAQAWLQSVTRWMDARDAAHPYEAEYYTDQYAAWEKRRHAYVMENLQRWPEPAKRRRRSLPFPEPEPSPQYTPEWDVAVRMWEMQWAIENCPYPLDGLDESDLNATEVEKYAALVRLLS